MLQVSISPTLWMYRYLPRLLPPGSVMLLGRVSGHGLSVQTLVSLGQRNNVNQSTHPSINQSTNHQSTDVEQSQGVMPCYSIMFNNHWSRSLRRTRHGSAYAGMSGERGSCSTLCWPRFPIQYKLLTKKGRREWVKQTILDCGELVLSTLPTLVSSSRIEKRDFYRQ